MATASELLGMTDPRERARLKWVAYQKLLDKICKNELLSGEILPWDDPNWHQMVIARLVSVGKCEADVLKWGALKELFAQVKVPR